MPESIASSMSGSTLRCGHRHVGDLDAILILLEPHVVADADLGHDDAHLGGHVLPHALDAFQQIAAALGIGQADQADADFDLHRIDGQIILDPFLGRLLLLGLRFASLRPRPSASFLRGPCITAMPDAAAADHQQRHRRADW